VSKLKYGDRVRITTKRSVFGYPPGSRGIVRAGPMTDRNGKTFYTVNMDKDLGGNGAVFHAIELEPDV
jgi:hypothetical protein